MNLNISLNLEQSQREQNGLVACEKQANKETNFYCYGEFIGLTISKPNPELWSQLAYHTGYLTNIGQFDDRKYQTWG